MVTQQSIDEIAMRLHRFKTGERPHIQSSFHCGTSHCLAGDKCVDDFCEHKGITLEDFHAEYLPYFMPDTSDDEDTCVGSIEDVLDIDDEFYVFLRDGSSALGSEIEWNYARTVWDLSFDESCSLFTGSLKLDEMIQALKEIAAHHGLTVPDYL